MMRKLSVLVVLIAVLSFGCQKAPTEILPREDLTATKALADKKFRCAPEDLSVSYNEDGVLEVIINQDKMPLSRSEVLKEAHLLCASIEGMPEILVYEKDFDSPESLSAKDFYTYAGKDNIEKIAEDHGLTLEDKDHDKLLQAIQETQFHQEEPSKEIHTIKTTTIPAKKP